MAASVDLLTTDQLKSYLGISHASDDTLIGEIIDEISESVETHLGREVMKKARTEYYNPRGAKDLYLKHRPVDTDEAITIVEETNVPRVYDATALTTSQYLLDDEAGVIQRYGGSFPSGVKSLKVTYTAGWATAAGTAVPTDIMKAAKIWCAQQYYRAKHGADGISSENMGPVSVTFARVGMPADCEELLAKYRRYTF
jgi:uncharacterized phiE125 gp8 family phage protein